MKLSELIAAYGDDAVEFQNLDQCATNFQMTKKGTLVTFGSERTFGIDGTDKLGLVVWLDRKRVKEITAES
jgi:hypothetical protein